MIRIFSIVFVLCTLLCVPDLALAAKIKSSWKNPTANESSLQFTKVLVLVTVGHDFTRKVAEDKVVRIIQAGKKAEAVPSYTMFQITDLQDKELVKSRIEEMGFDGVIVMRYADQKESKKYDVGAEWDAYNYFWGAYYPAWGGVYNATTPDHVVLYVETMFYSLKDQKLIWSGISETKNPKNPAKVVGEIAEETAKYLRKQGLLPETK